MTIIWDKDRQAKFLAALKNAERVFSETEGTPGDEDSLPEYVPLPEQEEEVVAEIIARQDRPKTKTDD